MAVADDELPVPVEQLAAAVDAIGRCLAEIDSEPRSGVGFGRSRDTLLLLLLSEVRRQLENLSDVKVTNWPDVRWALRFSSARVQALAYTCAPEAGALRNALGSVRDLIVTRYPQALRDTGA